MKKNLGWITMTAVLAASPVTQARAEEDKIPFQACKNVQIVKSKDEAAALKAKGCLASVEVSTPGIGAHMSTSMEAISIADMLGNVGTDYVVKDLESRKKYWEGVKDCFDSSSPSASCKKQMETIKGAYGGFVGSLRKSLAQTQVSEKDGSLSAASDLKSFSGDKLAFIPNAFPDAVTGGLQPSELSAANAELAKKKDKRSKVQTDARVAYTATLSDGIQKNGLYLVSYLPKPSNVVDGMAQWDNKDWSKTVSKLIEDAKGEIAETKRAIDANKFTVPAMSTKDIVPGWGKDQRDLMYIATLTPEMEKYLTKNPQDCGKAIAAVKWMEKISAEKMVANVAAFALGGAATQAPKVLTSAGKVGKLLYGVSMAGGGYLGGAMLAIDHANTMEKADKEYRSLAKIGAEKGKEADVVDPKKYAEAQDAANKWVRNTVAGQALFLGGGVAAGKVLEYAAPVVAKAYVSTSQATKEALGKLFMKSGKQAKKLASEFEANAPLEMRATAGTNLVSLEAKRGMALAETTAADREVLATNPAYKMEPRDLETVDNMLYDAQPNVAMRLESEGKCKGEACIRPAADDSGTSLHEAMVSCAPGKGAK